MIGDLVQIDSSREEGRRILPSEGGRYLSLNDNSVYEILKECENYYEEFKDIDSGKIYKADLHQFRFKTISRIKRPRKEKSLERNTIEI